MKLNPANTYIDLGLIRNSICIYEELGKMLIEPTRLISRSVLKEEIKESELRFNCSLKILIYETTPEDGVTALVIEALEIRNFRQETIAYVYWDIPNIPLYPIDENTPYPLLLYRKQNRVNILSSLRRISKYLKNSPLNSFDSHLIVYIQFGLIDLFLKLMNRFDKQIRLLESYDIGAKYLVSSPSLIELVDSISQP